MLSSVEQAFAGRDEIRAALKTPAWEAIFDRNQSCTYLVAVCLVSCCWPKFQSIFNPCNPLQQTTRNIINAKI